MQSECWDGPRGVRMTWKVGVGDIINLIISFSKYNMVLND